MALASAATGTVAADGTEQTLGSALTTAKSFVLVTDLNPMVDGDVIELRIYTKAISGGTERLAYMATFSHAQFEPHKFSVPVPALRSFKATLKQTAGSNHSYDWEIVSLD